MKLFTCAVTALLLTLAGRADAWDTTKAAPTVHVQNVEGKSFTLMECKQRGQAVFAGTGMKVMAAGHEVVAIGDGHNMRFVCGDSGEVTIVDAVSDPTTPLFANRLREAFISGRTVSTAR